MIPDTSVRVEHSTAASINQRIQTDIQRSVRWHASHPERIAERLRELDREWDVERVLEVNASTLALSGVILTATVDRRWLALPAVLTSFLLQHAIQGPSRAGARPCRSCGARAFAPRAKSRRSART